MIVCTEEDDRVGEDEENIEKEEQISLLLEKETH